MLAGKSCAAWLVAYLGGRAPDLAVRQTSRQDQPYFDMACLLGYACEELQLLTRQRRQQSR